MEVAIAPLLQKVCGMLFIKIYLKAIMFLFSLGIMMKQREKNIKTGKMHQKTTERTWFTSLNRRNRKVPRQLSNSDIDYTKDDILSDWKA
ncbi:hypothetical protein [Pedobacter alpinus]|uniref:Uncharacterized protein n=1 Tax=Pedobacter alpinus TaxID=1590643 RepID=A0ABW5TW39_9SPHI